MALELWEIIVVVAVLLILFRPSTITNAARSTGHAWAELRRALGGSPEEPSEDLKQLARTLGINTVGKSARQLSDEIAAKSSRDLR